MPNAGHPDGGLPDPTLPQALFRLASRILVVDDEQHIARFLQFLLNKEGYQTAVAYDGESALELYRTFQPDAILLDLILPGISGLDVLKAIHSSPAEPSLHPVILLLTGLNLQDLPADIMDFGVAVHCAKPVAPSTLMRHLHRHGLYGYAARMVQTAEASAGRNK
ncbi:MAG: response regulator [Bryobacterales bacterium]|nr:response regulator [Bryobacterales bacterium]